MNVVKIKVEMISGKVHIFAMSNEEFEEYYSGILFNDFSKIKRVVFGKESDRLQIFNPAQIELITIEKSI